MNNADLLRRLLRPVQRLQPILAVGGRVVVTRHDDVCEVLSRDEDFTVSEVNGPALDRLNGPFLLGLDRSPLYLREKEVLRRAVYPDDLEGLRAAVRRAARQAVAGGRELGRLDVVQELARPLTYRLAASYFGLPGPDQATMLRWMQAIFRAVFLDFGAPGVQREGAQAAAELHAHVDELIARRQAEITAGQSSPDDVLTRLVRMQSDPETRMSDEGLRRQLTGVAVAAFETQKAVAHAVEELLRRPDTLAAATAAAKEGDMAGVAAFTFEALRFRPPNPFVVRHVARPVVLAAGTSRRRRIPAGRSVVVALVAAMFDPSAVDDPTAFRTDRPAAAQLVFGHGLHSCFGEVINRMHIPEIVAALLEAGPLTRAPERGRLSYDGPFAANLVVQLEPAS